MCDNLTGKTKEVALMKTLSTTRMSSKGQVVIPENIRKRLRLEAGARFVIVAKDDVVILKTIVLPAMREFDALVRQARAQALRSGMRPADLRRAIARARARA